MTEPLDDADRAELLRLRNEVEALRAAGRRRRGSRSWQAVVPLLLIVVGCVLTPVSLVAVWAHVEVTDTDRFVASVSPLIREPSVQAVITDRVTNTIFSRVDVRKTADQAVSALAAHGLSPQVADRLHGLTGPLATSLHGFVHTQIGNLVASAQFAAVWDRAVRVAHQQAMDVLSGNSSAVTVSQGQVVLDLAPFIDAAKQQLVSTGFTVARVVPTVHTAIVLTDATNLLRARSAYRLLDAIATWLPWLTLALLAVGVLVARDRRRALRNTGIGVAASMLALAVGLIVVRNVLVHSVSSQAALAVGDSFDTLVNFLRIGLRTAFVLGLVIALAAFLTGPAPAAMRTRRVVTTSIDWLRRHSWLRRRGGAVGDWVHGHRAGLRIGVVIVAVLVFVFLDQLSVTTVLVLVLALCVCLGVIQFLDQPRRLN